MIFLLGFLLIAQPNAAAMASIAFLVATEWRFR
jgi:hypothetical protein